MLFIVLSCLLYSLSFVELEPQHVFQKYMDSLHLNEMTGILAKGDIDMSTIIKEYIQQHLNQNGIKNEIPYMDVVSCSHILKYRRVKGGYKI